MDEIGNRSEREGKIGLEVERWRGELEGNRQQKWKEREKGGLHLPFHLRKGGGEME